MRSGLDAVGFCCDAWVAGGFDVEGLVLPPLVELPPPVVPPPVVPGVVLGVVVVPPAPV